MNTIVHRHHHKYKYNNKYLNSDVYSFRLKTNANSITTISITSLIFSVMMCRRSPTDSDDISGDFTEIYIQIVTSSGRTIPVHANVLASASTVLECMIDRPRKHRSSEISFPITGVPSDAVVVFVGFLYSGDCTEEDMKKYGIHLLALSHVYLVPHLKSRCTKALIERLTIDNVIDAIQLARLCDAPDLYLKGMKLVSNSFSAIEETEGWKFLQNHDPFLELEILQFIDETELICIEKEKF